MATFLTTRKMSPELAARVEAAVTGKPVGRSKASPKLTALLRAGGVAAVIALVAWIAVTRRQSIAELEADRAALLAELHEDASRATDADKAIVPRIEVWAGLHSGAYEGDLVDGALRDEGARQALLARPIVYVRGPLGGFSSTKGIAEMGETTFRDAFVLCLFEPPSKRSEKLLREAARAALAGGERVKAAAHVERFHVARAGAPLLMPAWEERVRGAEKRRELAELRGELKRASLREAVRVMKTRLLLTVMDEPKDGNGPTEMDGANRHHVRVTLLDMEAETEKVLLRQRLLVDPAWISVDTRAEYGSGINSCELALEVRAAMTGVAPPAKQ